MSPAVSPLAPTEIPEMPVIAGVKLATAAAGIRYKGRTDVLLAVMDKGTTVAGVFTQSKCPSAPVEWCRAKLPRGFARALVVNSGNANAFTGKTGRQATALTAAIAAVSAVACRPVLPVKALALPEFTTSARADPPLEDLPPPSLARHHSTGAEGHFDLVKTPATAVPLSMTASSTSVRPL